MRNCFLVFLLAVAAVVAGGAPARAGFFSFPYLEPVNGDLSNDRFNPTELVAGLGSNILVGDSVTTTPGDPSTTDLDYFTVTVPAGLQLDALVLLSFAGEGVAFIAMQAGTTFTLPPDTVDVGSMLGWTHFGILEEGTDLFPLMAGQPGVIGFTTPLPSGSYTFWVQETGAITSTYGFDFRTSEAPGPPNGIIPEPASLSLAGLGALLALGYARRRRGRLKVAPAPG